MLYVAFLKLRFTQCMAEQPLRKKKRKRRKSLEKAILKEPNNKKHLLALDLALLSLGYFRPV